MLDTAKGWFYVATLWSNIFIIRIIIIIIGNKKIKQYLGYGIKN